MPAQTAARGAVFFSSRRRHTRLQGDWSSDVCSSDLVRDGIATPLELAQQRATVAGQQAAIPQLEQQELQTRATLALLLGRPPEGFDEIGRASCRERV